MSTKTTSSKSSSTKTATASHNTGRLSPNVIQHSLKPTSPGSQPTTKPGPGPKTK